MISKKSLSVLAVFIGLCLVAYSMSPAVYEKFSQENKRIDLNWVLVDPVEKSRVNLKDFEGQVIFINLWAEWCRPCVEEMPGIQNLYNRFKDRVVFVTVVERYLPATKLYIEESGFTFPVYEASTPRSYNTRGTIPATFIIGRNSEVAMHAVGEYKWDGEDIVSLLENLL